MYLNRAGRYENNIFEPSSGGIGIRLNRTNTKFKKDVAPGDFLVVTGLSISVQARKVVKVIDDTTLLVENGFIGTVSSKPVMVSKKGLITGVSINCGGAGVVEEKDVAADDIITFYDENGLKPVYGDSGANTFKIVIQAK